MFEINSKPKHIIIQQQVKSGDWLTVTKMDAHRRCFSFEEIANLLDLYEVIYNTSIRILNDYDKVILSTASYGFCRLLENAGIVTSHILNDDPKNVTAYSVAHNTLLPNIRDFQRFIARHGGVKKWKQYPIEKKDDYTICGKLILRDETALTVAFY